MSERGHDRGSDSRAVKLNDLTAREHLAFLMGATPMPHSTKEDVAFAIECGGLPLPAMSDALTFFTKEDEKVLDLFSGAGRFLNLCAHLSRVAMGIDLLQENQDKYVEDSQSDMFAKNFQFHVGDVQEVIDEHLEEWRNTFDFAFIDPPRALSKHTELKRDFSRYSINEYVFGLQSLVSMVSRVVLKGKYIAVHVDQVFSKGQLWDVPGMLAANLSASDRVRCRLSKVWYYPRRSGLGNLGVIAPVINTSHLLGFEVMK